MNAEGQPSAFFAVWEVRRLERWRTILAARLTPKAAESLLNLSEKQAALLEEMRFRSGQLAELVFDGESQKAGQVFLAKDMEELITALCGFARYAYEAQMAQGYIPLEDGHRAGICGRMTFAANGRPHMAEVVSVCIRIARHIPNASLSIRHFLPNKRERMHCILLLGPPGCGKTTVLRDAAIYLAESGLHTAVCDEREEFFGGKIPEAAVDVMSGVDKARAVCMLLRTMAPQVVVCDEIGNVQDADAILDAVRCGVGVLASAHAANWEDIQRRPILRKLYEEGAFEYYLFLGHHGKLAIAYDAQGTPIGHEQGG